jgi:CRISPR-associated endonuclease/helicase Cas3
VLDEASYATILLSDDFLCVHSGVAVQYAHSLPERDEANWELLSKHLEEVGARAAEFAAFFGAEEIARAAGLLHDIGKCSDQYQKYIRGKGSSPDHSTAGAQVAVRRYATDDQAVFGRLIAFAVAGHHAGLADGTGNNAASLDARLAKAVPHYDGWEAQTHGLSERLRARLPFKPARKSDPGYSLAFLGRMLFSCLVDADFLATERFYAQATGEAIQRGGHASLSVLQARLKEYMAGLIKKAEPGPIDGLRADILAHARAKAALPPGLFTMTVPTGGGKTLASLAFAFDHAAQHGLERIIYVIPYTSIIEQTARVFREALGEDNVLEHHGNVDWGRPLREDPGRADDEGPAGFQKLLRAAENWDVPVVVTTAVQFFESLHAARPSRCRKLHNLPRSVVILDEAQTLPVHLLRPCMAAIDELAANYGASVVLCTATQPALKRQDGFAGGLDIPEDRELAPNPEELYRRLRRVKVEYAGCVPDAVIVARFAETERMLCIVNSRKHAQVLFGMISRLSGACHLTTLMCPLHRRAMLADIRTALAAERPVRLVATSLVEAGVDLDFPEVWRAETGLDSLAQAAGRCNREGKLPVGRTVLFEAADHKLPLVFRQPVDAMKDALRHHGDDPLGLEAVRQYFRTLYWAKGEDALDAAKLAGERYPILAAVKESFDARSRKLDTPFASIAAAFHIIEDTMDPVIVPWRGGRDPDEVPQLLAALRFAARPPGAVLRRLQQFTVSVPMRARLALIASGAVQPVSPDYGDRFVTLVADSLYSDQIGLSLDPFGMSVEAGFM